MTSKFCEQCGAALEAGAQFCEQCGAPVTEDVEPAIASPQPVSPPPAQYVSPPPAPSQPVAPPPPPQAFAPPPLPSRPPVEPPKARPSGGGKRALIFIIVGLILVCLVVAVLGVGYFAMKGAPFLVKPSATSPIAWPSTTPIPGYVVPTSNIPWDTLAVPEPTNTEISGESAPVPACPGAAPARLQKNEHAQVVNVGGYSIIFYSMPQSGANEVGSVPEGTTVIIREGPLCSEQSYWWLVEFGEGGQSGWAMEATADGTYLLEGKP